MTEPSDPGGGEAVAQLLETQVFSGGATRPFGELSVEAVEARAGELGDATGFGHRSRVASVASAWRALGKLMRERGAATVAELEPTDVAEQAAALWIVPPGGSLLP